MEILVRRLVVLIAAMSCLACIAADNEDAALERRVKAVFISKFADFVAWPASAFRDPSTPIVIGVAGAGALADELDQAVAGRLVGERPLRVRRIDSPELVRNCHIVVIGRSVDRARSAEILAAAHGKPILTVTERDAEQQQGSIIHFLVDDGRIRFDISRDAAERNGLKLSSQLLGVARQVKASSQ